jgi:hypothetical protein
VRRWGAVLGFLAAGCSGFAEPDPDTLKSLRLPGPASVAAQRITFTADLDSPKLAGRFSGVAIGESGPRPQARVQLLPDLGPKAVDLLARPDRILGWLPQQKEGVDCALPGEAGLHLITLMGITVLEQLAPLEATRIAGVRRDGEAWLLDVPSVVPGCRTTVRYRPGSGVERRDFRWIWGVSWSQEFAGDRESVVRGGSLTVRILVVERTPIAATEARRFRLELPEDVAVVKGSRK